MDINRSEFEATQVRTDCLRVHIQQTLTLLQSRSRANARVKNEFDAAEQSLNHPGRCQHQLADGESCGEKANREGRDHILPICWNFAGRPDNLQSIEMA